VHPFGSAAAIANGSLWANWDIARAVRLSPTSTAAHAQGWVMDGWGGIHAFGGAQRLYSYAYWPNRDAAVQMLVE
jgi:hypothetical protein